MYLGTHRAGAETRQDPIRLKNLLKQAETALEGQGLSGAGIESLLRPARALVEDYDFWQHQDEGLAIFCAPGLFLRYRVDITLPELVVVGERFHLKPLLPYAAGNGRFYILALSQNRARLFRATRESILELEPEGMPASLAEAMRSRVPDGQLQAHSVPAFHGRPSAAVFHGHGGFDQNKKDLLFGYFRHIDRGIRDLCAEDHVPLVLAAVDYLYPIYRRADTSGGLLDRWISGSPDNLTARELHERALPLALDYFLREKQDAADRYLEAWHTQRASNTLADVLAAAQQGRVQSLFVAAGVQLWGSFNTRMSVVSVCEEPMPGTQDLLNLAALRTLTNGGSVYAVPPREVPGGGALAAVYRY
jgi:hypothetical protein